MADSTVQQHFLTVEPKCIAADHGHGGYPFSLSFSCMVNTVRFSRNLFVVGEDEYRNICAVVTGNQPIDIIIYGTPKSIAR